MTGKDELYNGIRSYLEVKGVRFDVDSAPSLCDEFVKRLASALFPLNEKAWIAINEKHNRGDLLPIPNSVSYLEEKFLDTNLTNRTWQLRFIIFRTYRLEWDKI